MQTIDCQQGEVARKREISLVFNLENYGVAVIGKFPHALPGFAMPRVSWQDVHLLLPAAVAISSVSGSPCG